MITRRFRESPHTMNAVQVTYDNAQDIVDWINANGGTVRLKPETDSDPLTIFFEPHDGPDDEVMAGDWVIEYPAVGPRSAFYCPIDDETLQKGYVDVTSPRVGDIVWLFRTDASIAAETKMMGSSVVNDPSAAIVTDVRGDAGIYVTRFHRTGGKTSFEMAARRGTDYDGDYVWDWPDP